MMYHHITDKPPVTGLYLTIQEYNELVKKRDSDSEVKANNTADDNILSVIGELLERHISGPASYPVNLDRVLIPTYSHLFSLIL